MGGEVSDDAAVAIAQLPMTSNSMNLAVVTGVVFGWPSVQGAIAAIQAGHARGFLLDAMTADF